MTGGVTSGVMGPVLWLALLALAVGGLAALVYVVLGRRESRVRKDELVRKLGEVEAAPEETWRAIDREWEAKDNGHLEESGWGADTDKVSHFYESGERLPVCGVGIPRTGSLVVGETWCDDCSAIREGTRGRHRRHTE